MLNILHLTHQTPLFKPHAMFQMCQKFATWYNTVSNMRLYRHQCQKYFGLFNYFSLSSHQISLSPSTTHLSLSVFGSLIANLTTPRQSHHATNHHHSTPVCMTTTSLHADLCLIQRCKFVLVDVGLGCGFV